VLNNPVWLEGLNLRWWATFYHTNSLYQANERLKRQQALLKNGLKELMCASFTVLCGISQSSRKLSQTSTQNPV